MNSEDTRKIIKKIAKEEGLSEWAVRTIILSQFDGIRKIMASGIPDRPDTFRGIFVNAFGVFRVIKSRFRKFKGKEQYEKEKRRRYDNKK